MIMSVTAFGQSYTKEKRVERSFPIYDDTEIEISNKYGDITIENWDKDSVKVVIDYKVVSTKEAKLNKTFDAISFDFKANQYYVVVNTEFIGSGSFWSDVSDIASNLFTGGTNSSIDYIVYVPNSKNLKLNLKYGNIYMTNHTGDIKLSLSNGDLKAHKLSGNTQMDVVFGDMTINNIVDGEIKINYGSLITEDATRLKISGQSSEYEISNVEHLIVDSKRDKIEVDEAGTISGETYFTHIVIDELRETVDLKTKYGSLKVKEFNSDVKAVNLNATNTTVNIYLQEEENYQIDITSDDKADITYSSGLGDFTTQEISGKDKIMNAKCLYGDMQNAIPINIDMRSGLLSIKLEK